MGVRFNVVEVSDFEIFFVNGNKLVEFFMLLYCGECLCGMGCKGRIVMVSWSVMKIIVVMVNGRWFFVFIWIWFWFVVVVIVGVG